MSAIFTCPNGCEDPYPGWWSPGPKAQHPPCSNCDAPLDRVAPTTNACATGREEEK